MTKKEKAREGREQKREKGFLVKVISELSGEIIADPSFKKRARPIVEKAMLKTLSELFEDEDVMRDLTDNWCLEDMAPAMATFLENVLKDIGKKIRFSIRK